MAPGYSGRKEEDIPHRHDALASDEFYAGVESENPEEDRRFRKELMKKLRAHPELDVSEVRLNVKGGYVSITGRVNDINAKSTVEAIIANTEGVVDVVNFLQLNKGFDAPL